MLLRNNNPSSKVNIDKIKKELHAESDRFSNSDDSEYQVMHSPYANDGEAFRCLNRVIAKKISNPPRAQFKRINLVPLPTQSVNHHPTNKQVISNKKALSKDRTKLEVSNESLQSRSFPSNSVKKPYTNLKLLTELSQSQEIQKKNELSGDGMFVKEKDSKGDYYYYCDDDIQMKQHAKMYEYTASNSSNIRKQINSPLLAERILSYKETRSDTVQRIVPRRLAPPPPSHSIRNPINNSGPKTMEKKGKKPKFVPNNKIFEDLRQGSKFSIYASQLRAEYEYLS